jgi:hypothetical protein
VVVGNCVEQPGHPPDLTVFLVLVVKALCNVLFETIQAFGVAGDTLQHQLHFTADLFQQNLEISLVHVFLHANTNQPTVNDDLYVVKPMCNPYAKISGCVISRRWEN